MDFIIQNLIHYKICEVSEIFLRENLLDKAETGIENDHQKFRNVWIKAKEAIANQKCEKPTKIKGVCGGAGPSFMIPFTKLGHTCSIIGRIGNDQHGEKIEKHLAQNNIHSLLIKSIDQLETGTALCFITPDRERTMLAHLGATKEFTANDITAEKIQDYEHWHIDGYSFLYGLALKCIEIATNNKAKISISLPTKNFVKMFKDSFEKAIPYVHYIFGNVEEILTLAGIDHQLAGNIDSIQKAFAIFPTHQTVVATDGGKGSWVKVSQSNAIKHYPVPMINPDKMRTKTGAGDVWSGSFLALALQGEDVESCIHMANEVAVEWIQKEPGTYLSKIALEIFQGHIAKK